MKQNTVILAAVVGGIFVVILIAAGIWMYLRSPAEPSAAVGVIQGMQQQASNASTSVMDTNASAAPKYEIAPGLEAQDITEGSGTPVANGQTVSVKYTGTLPDGTVFDASDLHGGAPFTFTLGGGQVIKGWDLGVVGMKPGGVRMLTIAPALGYGPNDYGPIPGNSTLTFKVEMIGLAQ